MLTRIALTGVLLVTSACTSTPVATEDAAADLAVLDRGSPADLSPPDAPSDLGGDAPTDLGSDASVNDAPDASGGADADYDAGPCMGCVAQTVRWSVLGGFDAGASTTASLSACRVFTDTRRDYGTGRESVLCTATLGGCEATDGVARLQRILAHPDVVAALREESPFFGINGSSTDQAYLQVRVDDRTLSVGSPCPRTGCPSGVREIPPAIAALAEFLNSARATLSTRCEDAGAPDAD